MLKYALNVGAVAGLLLAGIDLISLMMNMHESMMFEILAMGLFILALVFGIKRYRDSAMNGFISYQQSLGLGALISCGAALVTAFFLYAYFTFIDASFLAETLEKQSQLFYENPDLTDEQIELSVNMLKKVMSPGVMAVSKFFGAAITGVVFSLIISIFMKNPEPFFEEQA